MPMKLSFSILLLLATTSSFGAGPLLENAKLQDQIDLLKYKNQGLVTELEHLQTEKKKTKRSLKKMEKELAHLKNEKAELQKKYQLATKELAQKNTESDALKLKGLENESHLQTIATLESKNRELRAIIAKNSNELSALQARLASHNLKHAKELTPEEQIRNDKLERAKVKALASRYWQGRSPASTQTLAKPIDLKSEINTWVKARAQDFRFDESSNSILILAGKEELFSKASSELLSRTKILLHDLERFLSKLEQKGLSFEVIGHASPSYRGRPIHPQRAPASARAFNQKLSYERAESAKRYLEDLSAHRLKFKAKGAGFDHPIARNSTTAIEDQCGDYDCSLSRRLEIKILGLK